MLHTEPSTEVESFQLGAHHQLFLKWIKDILQSEENFERFRSLFRPPLMTNELTESIFSQFERVFEAQNSHEKITFQDSTLEADAADYRVRIGDHHFWETQGFEAFKNSIDDILVVDLPKLKLDDNGEVVSNGGLPEPYYYLLDINAVIDIENHRVKALDHNGKPFYFFKTEYLIFHGKDAGLVHVFDDTFYRTFSKGDNDTITLIDEVPHDLEFCPARSFWTTPLNSHCSIQKRSPITNSLSEMDWLLFFSIAKKYLELYAPFPIYAVYKGKCDYKTEAEGGRKAKCVDGYLEFEGVNYVGPTAQNSRVKCPRCKNKIKVGPGNIIELSVPKDGTDFDIMANPMKVIPAEKDSLGYMEKAVKEKYDEIFQNCVGRGADTSTDQAQNELQIRASFESRTAVLLKIKRNFEIIHTFALDTIFRLRYGSKFVACTINYGDEFFTKDAQVQTEELNKAKTAGAPVYEISARRLAIWETMYKNNPDMLDRMKTLIALEPFPDSAMNDVANMYKATPDLVSIKDLVIKMQFNAFINRFEREQTNINAFGRNAPFNKKIDLIREELSKYADEYISASKATNPAPPEPDPAKPPFGK
jgi:hypothetical protein